jgi:hypothetical protein
MQRVILFVGALIVLGVLSLALMVTGVALLGQSASAAPAQVAGSQSAQLAPVATPTCAPSWQVVSTADVSDEGNELTSVDAVTSSDVWAVGNYIIEGFSLRRTPDKARPQTPLGITPPTNPNQYIERTLVEHWDGTLWDSVPSPNVGTDSNALYQVTAIASNDVWAVGYYVSALGVAQTLTEHWDGTTWTVVASPNASTLQDNELTAVDAVSATDVWVVGYASDDTGALRTLTEHWDGTAWSIVASPNADVGDNILVDVAAITSNDVWAVGYYVNSLFITRSLALHWNGTAWTVVTVPAVGSGSNYLDSVDGVASNDLWVIGSFYSTAGGYRILSAHWDGTTWTVVPVPTSGFSGAQLYAIDALASNDIWAVGVATPESAYTAQGLTLHWDGTAWTVVRSAANDGFSPQFLYGVVAIAQYDVWAVGQQGAYYSPNGTTLAEHYSTACLTCPQRFVDVPPSDPFYAAIQCLACQGLVTGYPVLPSPPPPPPTSPPFLTPTPVMPGVNTPTSSPTPNVVFRPYSDITRGQLSKIVSNSAGYADDPDQQMFQDVPPWDTFYVWINRLARRGIITGYPCGGANEPCVPPDNLPYFRPGLNATRGQIAKIISNAAGFEDTHTEQDFADVPLSNPFYIYIARLYSRSVVNGYPCGGPNEPCVPPDNLPYFRWYNNATRGQVSKMDAKVFFPNCYVP